MRGGTVVAAITVTLNPDFDTLAEQLERLKQCGMVVLVDNGSMQHVLNRLRPLVQMHDNVTLHLLGSNMGIAHAQNVGAQVVLSVNPGTDYLLFLDHDSVPRVNCLSVLLSTFESLRKEGRKVAAVGPELVDPRSGKKYGFHCFRFPFYRRIVDRVGDGKIACEYLNSSGTMISIQAWRIVGAFREAFFIDHVDTEWCFRAKSHGFELYGIFGAVLDHEMGDHNETFWFLGERSMPYRKPLRHYYIVRNSIFLYREHYVPFWWKLLNVLKIFFTLSYFGVVPKDRSIQLSMITKGIKHGLYRKRTSFGDDR